VLTRIHAHYTEARAPVNSPGCRGAVSAHDNCHALRLRGHRMTNDTIQDMHRSLFSSSPPWAGAFGSMPNSRMSFTLSTFDNIDVVVMNLGRVRCCVMLCRRLSCDVKTARQFGIQACVRMSTSDPSQKGIMSPDDASPKVSKSRQTKIYQIWHGHLPLQNRPELVVGYISDWCSFQVSYFRPPSFLLLPLCACKVRPAARRL